MTKLDERTLEDIAHLGMNRAADALLSVLQLVDDPHQRSSVALAVASLMLAAATKVTQDGFEEDIGKKIGFGACVIANAERMVEAVLGMGEEAAGKICGARQGRGQTDAKA